MAYKVIYRFREAEDTDNIYEVGDTYPKGEYNPTDERIECLSTIHPKYRRSFIEFVETEEEKIAREAQEAQLKADADEKAQDEAIAEGEAKKSTSKKAKVEDK